MWIEKFHGETKDIEGFNRYMVECEFVIIVINSCMRRVLIDTWWNVNVYGQ